MKRRCLEIFLVCSILFGVAGLSFAACDQTLSVGANVASAVSSAPNDSTICLNNGNYGSMTFANISRSGYVTVSSTTGKGATLSPQISASSFIKLQSLTISGASITACAKNIEIRNSTFTGALGINNYYNVCSNYPSNIVIHGNIFGDIGAAFSEGRLDIRDREGGGSMGITVSNNTFGPGCQSDGIQLTGGASGVTIGPGNIFDNIVQDGPTHCDCIQFYGSGANNTIIGNWFRNSSSVFQNGPASSNTVFTHNILQDTSNSFNSDAGGTMLIEHNTLYNHNVVFKIGPNISAIIRNNILIGNTVGFDTSTCVSCPTSYQLCNTTGQCSATNQLIGNPTFVGGSTPPATWPGWQLAVGSLGKNAGSDGLDRGTNYYGPEASPAPVSPVNLLLQ